MEMEILSLACEIIYGKINVCSQTAINNASFGIRQKLIWSWLLEMISEMDVIVIIVMCLPA